MDLYRFKLVAQAAAAAALGFWQAMPELTQLLVWLMVIDTTLGIVIAVREHNLSPTAAWAGVTRKVGALLLVGLAAVLDIYLHQTVVDLVQAASAFYIVPELTSIMRNAAILDVPVFVQLKDVLRYFQAQAEDKDAGR